MEKDFSDEELQLKWMEWLLKVAQAEKNKEEIGHLARLLFNKTLDTSYYMLHKRSISPRKRSDKINEWIEELKTNRDSAQFHILAHIYLAEGRMDDLLALLKTQPEMKFLSPYESHLTEDYKPELIALYRQIVVNKMQRSGNRAYYQAAFELIEKMSALGGEEEVKQLVEALSNQYSYRSMMLRGVEEGEGLIVCVCASECTKTRTHISPRIIFLGENL